MKKGEVGSDLKNNDYNQKKKIESAHETIFSFNFKKSKDMKLTIRICFDPFTPIATTTTSFFFLIL